MAKSAMKNSASKTTSMAYWAWYFGRYYLGASRFQSVKEPLENQILKESPKEDELEYKELPQFNVEELSPQSFQKNYLLKNQPVVLRGLAKNFDCVKKWDLDFFKEALGHEKCPVRKKINPSDKEWNLLDESTVSDLIENIQSGGDHMASFVVDIFNRNPTLRNDLDLKQLGRYVCRNPRLPIKSTQLFLSGKAGRTAFHCAPGANMFIQVSGVKRWTFVAPEYTKWMYPNVREDLFYGYSPVCHNFSNIDQYPLFKKVPKLRVELHPGDVLFSPQWWWHAVDNLSDSIGVACRTFTKLYYGNLPFAFLNITSVNVLKNYYKILKTGWNTDQTIVKTFFKDRLSEGLR